MSEAKCKTIAIAVVVSADVVSADRADVVSADDVSLCINCVRVPVSTTPRLIIRPPIRLIVFIASRSFLGLFFRFNQEMFRTWFPENFCRDGEEEANS